MNTNISTRISEDIRERDVSNKIDHRELANILDSLNTGVLTKTINVTKDVINSDFVTLVEPVEGKSFIPLRAVSQTYIVSEGFPDVPVPFVNIEIMSVGDSFSFVDDEATSVVPLTPIRLDFESTGTQLSISSAIDGTSDNVSRADSIGMVLTDQGSFISSEIPLGYIMQIHLSYIEVDLIQAPAPDSSASL